jgi:hypothetical protein
MAYFNKKIGYNSEENNSLVKEFQKVLLDDKDFLKNLIAQRLQSILQDEFIRFI